MVAVTLTWALFSALLVAAAIFSFWRARAGEAVAAGFVGGVGAWLLGLGWGNHAHYAAWQIAVAAIAMVALTAAVAWRVPRTGAGALGAVTGPTLGFGFAWSVQAGLSDSTGMWPVGLMLLNTGLVVGLGVVVGLVFWAGRRAEHGNSASGAGLR